jgi:hypothetical protein
LIFRGLNFSRNADIGQISHFWMGTNQRYGGIEEVLAWHIIAIRVVPSRF